jgi:hypothetical protein
MANRYWVGGTGTWNTASTTNWSDTSGGSGGFSVPTVADSVFFDQAGTYTVTMTGALACLDITVSAGTVTFATGTSPTLSIAGSMSLLAGTVWNSTGAVTFSAASGARTITTNGVTVNTTNFQIGPTGGPSTATFTLGSALTLGSTTILGFASGTFDTSSSGNYTISTYQFSSNNTTARTINLNGSTVNISFPSNVAFNLATTTNLTFNAGTSQINLSGATTGIASGGLTFYNVSCTSVASTGVTITGANTFNNLTFTGRTTVGITPVTFSASQTISGTLTVSEGTASAFRNFLASDTLGTTRTLTCAAVSLTDADFRDITIAGAAAPASGTRFGDCKGNSGITFPAAKTVYYRQTGSANWGATGSGSWSATSGGALDATQFPLAQDTAVFPAATYPASGSTTTINGAYNIGTIDMSLRTSNTMTLATGSNTPAIYGNWINGTGTTLSGSGRITYAGRGAQTIRSEGKTFTQATTINSLGGSVTLQDAWVTSSGTTNNNPQLLAGTFDANGYNVTNAGTGTYVAFASTGTLARTVAIGSGTWTLSGSGSQWNVTGSNITVTGSGTISLTSASTKTFSGGGIQTYPTLNQGGTGNLTITGNNKFISLTDSSTGSVFLTSGTTTEVSTLGLQGSVGSLLTLNSTGTGNAILRSADPIIVGANSVNAGNVSGVFFIQGPIDYLSLSNISARYPLKVTNLTFPSGITLS